MVKKEVGGRDVQDLEVRRLSPNTTVLTRGTEGRVREGDVMTEAEGGDTARSQGDQQFLATGKRQ